MTNIHQEIADSEAAPDAIETLVRYTKTNLNGVHAHYQAVQEQIDALVKEREYYTGLMESYGEALRGLQVLQAQQDPSADWTDSEATR
jgi:hypothetical protein